MKPRSLKGVLVSAAAADDGYDDSSVSNNAETEKEKEDDAVMTSNWNQTLFRLNVILHH